MSYRNASSSLIVTKSLGNCHCDQPNVSDCGTTVLPGIRVTVRRQNRTRCACISDNPQSPQQTPDDFVPASSDLDNSNRQQPLPPDMNQFELKPLRTPRPQASSTKSDDLTPLTRDTTSPNASNTPATLADTISSRRQELELDGAPTTTSAAEFDAASNGSKPASTSVRSNQVLSPTSHTSSGISEDSNQTRFFGEENSPGGHDGETHSPPLVPAVPISTPSDEDDGSFRLPGIRTKPIPQNPAIQNPGKDRVAQHTPIVLHARPVESNDQPSRMADAQLRGTATPTLAPTEPTLEDPVDDSTLDFQSEPQQHKTGETSERHDLDISLFQPSNLRPSASKAGNDSEVIDETSVGGVEPGKPIHAELEKLNQRLNEIQQVQSEILKQEIEQLKRQNTAVTRAPQGTTSTPTQLPSFQRTVAPQPDKTILRLKADTGPDENLDPIIKLRRASQQFHYLPDSKLETSQPAGGQPVPVEVRKYLTRLKNGQIR